MGTTVTGKYAFTLFSVEEYYYILNVKALVLSRTVASTNKQTWLDQEDITLCKGVQMSLQFCDKHTRGQQNHDIFKFRHFIQAN